MQNYANLKATVDKKDKRIIELENKSKENDALFDALEQYSRKNSMRIDGIIENDTECLMSTVLHLFNSRMQVSPPIRAEDIDRLHRLGVKSPGKVRTVLVKFTSGRAKDRVIRLKGRLKPDPTDPNAPWKPLSNAPGYVPPISEFPEMNPGNESDSAGASREAPAATTENERSADGNDTDKELSSTDNATLDNATDIPESIVKAIGKRVFLNDDMTNRRDFMLYVARQAKRRKQINDVWVVNGMIKIKDLANTVVSIREIESIPDHANIIKEAEARRKPTRTPKR